MAPSCSLKIEEIISKEFLQTALQSEGKEPVPQITSYTVTPGTQPGDNYASLIYSIQLQLSNGRSRHLLAKCFPNHPSRQEFAIDTNMFYKEWQVYSSWIPELKRLQTGVLNLSPDQILPLPYAPFIHGQCIDFQSPEGKRRTSTTIHSLDNFILMEDIRASGFRMTNRRKPLDLDHMSLVVKTLAKTHALSWAYRHHVEPQITTKFPCLVTQMGPELLASWSPLLNANIDQSIRIFDAEFGPGNVYSEAVDKFRAHFSVIEETFLLGKGSGEGLEKRFRIPNPDPVKFGKDSINPEPWKIICHGDCWSNNMLFRYDPETNKPIEVVLVDLQIPKETCVVKDLQYVIYSCTDLELRRSHLDELLQLYHDTFNSVCDLMKTPTLPGFSMESLRFRFHRAKLFGLYIATVLFPIMLKGEEEEVLDLEEMEPGVDFNEAFTNLSSKGFEGNQVFKERLLGLVQGMMEDGVI